MENNYKIRLANTADRLKIHELIRESIAREKSLLNPSMVNSGFMEEFVDKAIRKGHMLIVENLSDEVELIGEVHYYCSSSNIDEDSVKEFRFFSRTDGGEENREQNLVSWLFGEIQNKHHDVFRVELSTPVCNQSAVDFFRKMGLNVEGNYTGRLKPSHNPYKMMVPLSWTNPSFN